MQNTMPVTAQMEDWLNQAGYEYHCFISWAHTRNKDMTECALRIKDAIEQELALSIPNPRVFLEKSELRVGAEWEERLRQALCRSMTMIAICAPIYYRTEHYWCGIEWAAMNVLSQERLPNSDFRAIIPILIKNDNNLPEEVRKIQHLDLSRIMIQGRNYYRTQDFRKKIAEIVERIENVIETLINENSVTRCHDFVLPTEPAFLGHPINVQPFPFRRV